MDQASVSRAETETADTDSVPAPGHAPDASGNSERVDPSQLPPDIERIDLSSPDYREHALERYEAMRARCPVSPGDLHRGQEGVDDQGFFNRPLWLVTDYEEGSRALLDRAFTVDVTIGA